MAESKLVIVIKIKYEKSAGDCSECYGCQEKIFGNMYKVLFVMGEKSSATGIKLCESCKEYIDGN